MTLQFPTPKQQNRFNIRVESNNLSDSQAQDLSIGLVSVENTVDPQNADVLVVRFYDDMDNNVLRALDDLKDCTLYIDQFNGSDEVVVTWNLYNTSLERFGFEKLYYGTSEQVIIRAEFKYLSWDLTFSD